MNSILPFIFAVLKVLAPGVEAGALTEVALPGVVIEGPGGRLPDAVYQVDSVRIDSLTVRMADVMGAEGESRRLIVAEDAAGVALDAIDGGSFGQSGFVDRFYFTDRNHDTMTAWFEVADANPVFEAAPEGGTTLELTDRVTLTVLNHDTGEQERFTLRDNQVRFKIDGDGVFRLQSVRPKSDDLQDVARYLMIYDTEGDVGDVPLDGRAFGLALRRLFPVPGRVSR